MLNDTGYGIEDNTSAQELDKPNNDDTMEMTAPATQLKLSTAQLCKMHIANKQHAKIRKQLIQGLEHPAFLLDRKVRDDNRYYQAVLVPEKI